METPRFPDDEIESPEERTVMDARGAEEPNADRSSRESLDEEAAEGAEPYFPPTDPVLDEGGRDIVGGFAGSSMDELGTQPSTMDDEVGDEAILEAVRRELGEDAETRGLDLDVQVRRGVVFLRGKAEFIEDADNAADVASRVGGVRQVVDHIATSEGMR